MTEDRNSPREIVIDLETDINTLEAYTGLLELAAQGVAAGYLGDESKEGLLRLAFDMSDCLERHHDQYRRLFAAVVERNEGEGAVKPGNPSTIASPTETDTRWQSIYGEWLRIKAAYIEREVSDEEGNQLGDREAALVLEMATTRAPYRHAILQKIEVLQDCLHVGGRWMDNRDTLLLASIRGDVQGIGS